MKAELTEDQIEKAWSFADVMSGKDTSKVREDFLGAEIHFDEYGQETPFGWCAEYVLSPTILSKNGIPCDKAFCEANIRVLFIGNYNANAENQIGYYQTKYKREMGVNKHQYVWQEARISDFGKEELRKQFNLSETALEQILKTKK